MGTTRDPDYDVAVIGAGQAGIPLARRLAAAGLRTCLFEREHLGGSCINFGCTPTKAALHSARLAHQAREGARYGVDVQEVRVDFPAVLERARALAEESREGLREGLEGREGLELLHSHARLDGKEGASFRVRAGGVTLTAARVVLDTGSRSAIPPVEGLEEIDFLTAENWLFRPELPETLVVLGGGYIGLEMAQFYRRMGSAVTVVEAGEEVTGAEDPEVAEALRRCLSGEGIEFLLETRVGSVVEAGKGLRIQLSGDAGEPSTGSGSSRRIDASHLLVATGRKPNTDELGLESVGVETDDRGFIQVDEGLATTADGIWATGDIRGGPMFTHTAWDDHRTVASRLLDGGDPHRKRLRKRLVPYAIFTDPELGRVGMTEKEARGAGHAVQVATLEMSRNGKARETGETAGFVKVVVDRDTDRILGAAVLAHNGAELVHEYLGIMAADAPFTVIRDVVHIHPTLSEALHTVLSSL